MAVVVALTLFPVAPPLGGGTAPVPSSHDFYPMSIGDTWTYESSVQGEFVNRVTDAVVHDERTYHRVRTTRAGRTSYIDVRIEGGRVYLKPPSGDEHLLVDFAAPLNHPFSTGPGGAATTTYVASHDPLQLFGSPYRHVRIYRHDAPQGGRYQSYYARGVGLIGMVWNETGQAVRLVRAEVGGKAIGNAAGATGG